MTEGPARAPGRRPHLADRLGEEPRLERHVVGTARRSQHPFLTAEGISEFQHPGHLLQHPDDVGCHLESQGVVAVDLVRRIGQVAPSSQPLGEGVEEVRQFPRQRIGRLMGEGQQAQLSLEVAEVTPPLDVPGEGEGEEPHGDGVGRGRGVGRGEGPLVDLAEESGVLDEADGRLEPDGLATAADVGAPGGGTHRHERQAPTDRGEALVEIVQVVCCRTRVGDRWRRRAVGDLEAWMFRSAVHAERDRRRCMEEGVGDELGDRQLRGGNEIGPTQFQAGISGPASRVLRGLRAGLQCQGRRAQRRMPSLVGSP